VFQATHKAAQCFEEALLEQEKLERTFEGLFAMAKSALRFFTGLFASWGSTSSSKAAAEAGKTLCPLHKAEKVGSVLVLGEYYKLIERRLLALKALGL
jgi:hypothetical protein